MFMRYMPRALRTVRVAVLPRRPVGKHCGIMPDKENPDVEVRFENYFNRADIDGWEVRKALCELHGLDLVPSPPVIIAALRACRRINDYALAIRMLETVRFKCGGKLNTFWPYICQEITPTLKELGVDLPEQLGYHKPELWKNDNEGVW